MTQAFCSLQAAARARCQQNSYPYIYFVSHMMNSSRGPTGKSASNTNRTNDLLISLWHIVIRLWFVTWWLMKSNRPRSRGKKIQLVWELLSADDWADSFGRRTQRARAYRLMETTHSNVETWMKKKENELIRILYTAWRPEQASRAKTCLETSRKKSVLSLCFLSTVRGRASLSARWQAWNFDSLSHRGIFF